MVLATTVLGIGWAQELKNELRFKYQYYKDNNGVWVNQPMLKVHQKVTERVGLQGHILLDALSAASRRVFYPLPGSDSASGLKETEDNNSLSIDAVTSASMREVRGEMGGGVTHIWKNVQNTFSLTGSREKDYQSVSGSLDTKWDLFNQNSNLTINYTRFEDQYIPVNNVLSYYQENGFYLADSTGAGWGGDRHVNSFTLGWTQTLSRTTLGMMSFGATHSEGYLGRPYYLVVVADTLSNGAGESGGIPYMEEVPDTRLGLAGVLQLRQFYPSFYREGAVQGEYRRTIDTWGINSHTFSILINQYIHSSVFLQFRYRYYIQNPAVFYKDRYTLFNVNPNHSEYLSYRTVDARLSEFDSQLLHAKLVFVLKNFVKPETATPGLFPTRFDLEAERYFRSTHPNGEVRRRRYEFYDEKGLTAWIIRGGIVFSY